jgi:AcrR family transcriptional regulator
MTAVGRAKTALDRRSIARAAVELIDDNGLGGLNMRALAERLGVGTMSLYHYVPNKDALYDAVVECLLEGIDLPDPTSGRWDERAARMARSLRAVALEHPNTVPLLVTRPFSTSASLRPCEAAFQVLAEAGLDEEAALIAFRTIVAYVLGFVMIESVGFFGGAANESGDFAALGLPYLAKMVPHMAERDIGADFDAGLAVVLSGSARPRPGRRPRR